jgi:rhodanese-related sulfurtransferase
MLFRQLFDQDSSICAYLLADETDPLPLGARAMSPRRGFQRRSSRTLQLAAAGFARVASLQGSMLEWNARKLPIERGYIENRQG